QDEIHNSLQGIPFASVDESYMGESIIIDVDRLKRNIEDLLAAREQYIYIEKEINDKTQTVDILMRDCMLNPDKDILDNINNLNMRLKSAQDMKRKAVEAVDQITDIEVSIIHLKEKIKELEDTKENFV